MKITYTSIDGVRKSRTFKTLKGARKFADDMVGPQDVEGGYYAVSSDGVGRITWSGVSRADLFGSDKPAVKLNAAHEFYRRGNDLYCRQAGYTRDHDGQKFGRVVAVMDNITGDHEDGFRLRHNDGEAHVLFDESQKHDTFEAALAVAKRDFLYFLSSLEGDGGL